MDKAFIKRRLSKMGYLEQGGRMINTFSVPMLKGKTVECEVRFMNNYAYAEFFMPYVVLGNGEVTRLSILRIDGLDNPLFLSEIIEMSDWLSRKDITKL